MMNTKSFAIIISTTIFLLLIPFTIMQFSNQVSWSILDFVIMGSLLIGVGLLFDLTLKKIKKRNFRILTFILIFALFLIIWAELAVGIFGTPLAGS